MANTQFSGPVYSNNGFRVGSYASGVVASPVATVGASQIQALTVTATANTDVTMSIPAGARILNFVVYTTTAFTGGTTTIALGSASGGAQYVAATAITNAGVVTLSPASTAPAGMLSFPGTLYIRINQGGTPTAVGAATIAVQYAL